MLFGVSAAGPRSAWAVGATRTYRKGRSHGYPVYASAPAALGRHLLAQAAPALGLPITHARQGGRHGTVERLGRLQRSPRDGPSGGRRSSIGTAGAGGGSSTRRSGRMIPYSASAPPRQRRLGGRQLWAGRQHSLSRNLTRLAAHWNGQHWQITPVPNPPGGSNSAVLNDVAAASPDGVWALGESQHLDFQGHDGLSSTGPTSYFLHSDGQDWQATSGTTPSVYDGVAAITAAPDGSAWAIGNCNVDDFSLRWTGDNWVTAPHPRDTYWRNRGITVPAKARRSRPPSCSSSSSAG